MELQFLSSASQQISKSLANRNRVQNNSKRFANIVAHEVESVIREKRNLLIQKE